MKLERVLISDPKKDVTALLAGQCDRLAKHMLFAHNAKDVLRLIQPHPPELIVLSLDLTGTPATKLVPKLLEAAPETLIVATYRELSVPTMEKIQALGVRDFVSHPVDVLEVFRAASRRFKVPFRRHDRYEVALEVRRADGVSVGQTTDISEGGLCVATKLALKPNESILVDVDLGPDAKPLRVRCLVLGLDDQDTQSRARLQFVRLFGPEQARLVAFLKAHPNAATPA